MLYPWQIEDAKRIFYPLLYARSMLFQPQSLLLSEANSLANDRKNNLKKTFLPHALLIYGPRGMGKQNFSQYLAQTLLCENNWQISAETDSKLSTLACGQCKSCHWFVQGNHPDFHQVLPENLQLNSSTLESSKTSDVYPHQNEIKPRALSKEIKVEQVRNLKEFCSISAHRGKLRVILIYPAQTLNIIAANALLKILEEPPVHVCFILVAEHINTLLPTIVSRCQRVPLTLPPLEAATSWLLDKKIDRDQAHFMLAKAGGAPLLALSYQTATNHQFEEALLKQLETGALCDVMVCGELVSKTNLYDFCCFLQCWVFDLMSMQLANKCRYFPQKTVLLSKLIKYVDKLTLGQYFSEISKIVRIANHPLNVRLTCETLLYAYCNLFSNEASINS